MIGTPIDTRRWATACLIATFVLGGFSFVAPTHASMASMQQSGSTDSMPSSSTACFTQGCIETHNTCKEHCVRPSETSTNVDAIAPLPSTQQVVAVAIQTLSTIFPHTIPIPVTDVDRSPPIHTFLRSVIKRE